jgi:transcription termination/antitermination protein NusA
LAIGKEGQNVRLAARLTGWKIDIKDRDKYDYAAEDAKFAAAARQQAAAQLEEELAEEELAEEELEDMIETVDDSGEALDEELETSEELEESATNEL